MPYSVRIQMADEYALFPRCNCIFLKSKVNGEKVDLCSFWKRVLWGLMSRVSIGDTLLWYFIVENAVFCGNFLYLLRNLK